MLTVQKQLLVARKNIGNVAYKKLLSFRQESSSEELECQIYKIDNPKLKPVEILNAVNPNLFIDVLFIDYESSSKDLLQLCRLLSNIKKLRKFQFKIGTAEFETEYFEAVLKSAENPDSLEIFDIICRSFSMDEEKDELFTQFLALQKNRTLAEHWNRTFLKKSIFATHIVLLVAEILLAYKALSDVHQKPNLQLAQLFKTAQIHITRFHLSLNQHPETLFMSTPIKPLPPPSLHHSTDFASLHHETPRSRHRRPLCLRRFFRRRLPG
ncbi:hypothetical protein L596_025323 [Steinernema carpocapsae]|uniref:Uncharacterized protein n=1 Tax=Steinernema carpocapsae TaxID=34508 RepID=A0A4V5ZYS6_STECR|nr:hypothetical protein L596_025323 [Steinernema carpocapsae]